MKILVVNLMQIGDLVLTTPVFRAIKSAYPTSFLAAAVNHDFAQLLQFNPFINQLFTLDKRSLASFIKTVKDIRNRHFDLCINLNRSERACAIAALSGAKRIVGYAKPLFYPFFNTVCPNLKRSIHQIVSHFRVLDAAGLSCYPIPQSDVFIGNTSLNLHLPNNIVAFNVGASWPSKRWLPNSFATVAQALIDRGFFVAFLGSKADIPIVDQCLAAIPDRRNVLVFTGNFSLLELAAFFDHCRLLITNDSGPLHIAAARNLPAVSIFGSSPVTGFAPRLHSHALLQSPASCHPCFLHRCPLKGDNYMRCMKLISPEVVLKYSLELLSTFDKPAKDLPHIQGAYDCRVIDLAKQN
ncbi:MAG: glycosyltransferase family 9 protein [Selenomonadaceae bacterium]|nr:glycosyltransferase family 9 protein [Selenomonadaceae bacterium]